MTYKEFLETKIELATESGFIVDSEKVNKALKPHQRDAVMWALRGGRRALFESFGLGKTVQEIEFCHLAAEHSGGRALIVLPLFPLLVLDTLLTVSVYPKFQTVIIPGLRSAAGIAFFFP